MGNTSPMTLLLIEDDDTELNKFKELGHYRKDIDFIAMTASGEEGLKCVKYQSPEGVILDLELHKGKGSGLQFLGDLKKASVQQKPIIIVTTNTPSNLVHNLVRDLGVDFIYYKRQEGYEPEIVVNTLLLLRNSIQGITAGENTSENIAVPETRQDKKDRIREIITDELDAIGINVRYKGRKYIEEALLILANKNGKATDSALHYVAGTAKVSYSSVIRSVQTAINNTWYSSDIDDLQVHYTARVDVRTGVPSPAEFILYYADKIRKII